MVLSDQLAKETIFITGASSGFGEACALLLAKHGAKLIINGRNEAKLLALKDKLSNDKVHIAKFDVSNKSQVQSAIESLPNEFKNITILINNAGLALARDPAYKCMLEDWQSMVNTNINGVLYCTHFILPKMVEQNNGYIINIGSIAGSYAYPGSNVYGATKAFLKQFSLNLRADLLGTNIRVTNIEPGLAETNFSVVRFKGDKQAAAKVYENANPLLAQDIAESILWCLTRPNHVNINSLEIMPTSQAFSALATYRK
jgi:3-hydroxy acid dehydrogenase / malonic semialdehyde reductase